MKTWHSGVHILWHFLGFSGKRMLFLRGQASTTRKCFHAGISVLTYPLILSICMWVLVKRTSLAQEILFYQYLGTQTQRWTQCAILQSFLIGSMSNLRLQLSLMPVEGRLHSPFFQADSRLFLPKLAFQLHSSVVTHSGGVEQVISMLVGPQLSWSRLQVTGPVTVLHDISSCQWKKDFVPKCSWAGLSVLHDCYLPLPHSLPFSPTSPLQFGVWVFCHFYVNKHVQSNFRVYALWQSIGHWWWMGTMTRLIIASASADMSGGQWLDLGSSGQHLVEVWCWVMGHDWSAGRSCQVLYSENWAASAAAAVHTELIPGLADLCQSRFSNSAGWRSP